MCSDWCNGTHVAEIERHHQPPHDHLLANIYFRSRQSTHICTVCAQPWRFSHTGDVKSTRYSCTRAGVAGRGRCCLFWWAAFGQLHHRFLFTASVPTVKLTAPGWLYLGGARTTRSSNFIRILVSIRTAHCIDTTTSTAQPAASRHNFLVHLSTNARSSIETFLFFPGHLFSPA